MQLLEQLRWERVADSVLICQYERRLNRPCFKEIWMVAHLSQLHQNAHDAEEIAVSKDVPRLVLVDVLVI